MNILHEFFTHFSKKDDSKAYLKYIFDIGPIWMDQRAYYIGETQKSFIARSNKHKLHLSSSDTSY